MRAWSDRRVEGAVGSILRAGVLLATLLVLVGAILALHDHGGERADYRAFRPELWARAGLAEAVRHPLDPTGRGLVRLGLLALIATPVARVVFSAFAFLAQRDLVFVAITLTVLAVLWLGLLGAVP